MGTPCISAALCGAFCYHLMQRFFQSLLTRFAGLAAIVALLAGTAAFLAPSSAGAFSFFQASGDTIAIASLPSEAQKTLALIKAGGPFPYAKDGTVFGNYERVLPKKKRGYYTEYTVVTPGLKNRGPKRIVAGKGSTGDPATSGEYWYTADHYKSFRRIVEK